MSDRLSRLTQLNNLLTSGSEDFTLATSLETYFLGSNSGGCRCKFNQVKSKLNQFWETTGRDEFNTLNNGT